MWCLHEIFAQALVSGLGVGGVWGHLPPEPGSEARHRGTRSQAGEEARRVRQEDCEVLSSTQLRYVGSDN